MAPVNPVAQFMYDHDPFSQWLGIQILSSGEGTSHLEMTVRKEMCNGFGIAHGGITFSLADSALAFASNAYGRKSVSIECSISHLLPVYNGDTLRTEVEEVSLTGRTGVYSIAVFNQDNTRVALFKGTVYRKSEDWVLPKK